MGPVETKPQTQGISPKVIAQLVVVAATYALVHFGIKVDADLSAVIAAVAAVVAGYLAPPGEVVR